MLLLVAGVGWVGVRLCGELRTAVTAVLLALLGTALLAPLHRRLVRAGVQRSVSAGLTCVAVVAVVGGAVYIVVAALVGSGDEIMTSLRNAAKSVSRHFGAAGTGLEDLTTNSGELLRRFGGTAASNVISGVSVVGESIALAVLALVLVFFLATRLIERSPAGEVILKGLDSATSPLWSRLDDFVRIVIGRCPGAGFERGRTSHAGRPALAPGQGAGRRRPTDLAPCRAWPAPRRAHTTHKIVSSRNAAAKRRRSD